MNFRLPTSSLYLVSLKNLAHFEMVKNFLKTFYIKVRKKAQLTVSVNYLLCAYCIYSINRPGHFKFLDLESGRLFEVGGYLRLGAY